MNNCWAPKEQRTQSIHGLSVKAKGELALNARYDKLIACANGEQHGTSAKTVWTYPLRGDILQPLVQRWKMALNHYHVVCINRCELVIFCSSILVHGICWCHTFQWNSWDISLAFWLHSNTGWRRRSTRYCLDIPSGQPDSIRPNGVYTSTHLLPNRFWFGPKHRFCLGRCNVQPPINQFPRFPWFLQFTHHADANALSVGRCMGLSRSRMPIAHRSGTWGFCCMPTLYNCRSVPRKTNTSLLDLSCPVHIGNTENQ